MFFKSYQDKSYENKGKLINKLYPNFIDIQHEFSNIFDVSQKYLDSSESGNSMLIALTRIHI